jgi:hypothetical protein
MRLRSHGGLACDFTISSAAGLTSITTLSSTRFTSGTNDDSVYFPGTDRSLSNDQVIGLHHERACVDVNLVALYGRLQPINSRPIRLQKLTLSFMNSANGMVS